MFELLKLLLTMPAVIVTCRPHVSLPQWTRGKFDLELDTIGFLPKQVVAYVAMAFTNPETGDSEEKIADVQSFLRRHQLIQGLVRIPIQLDALCYTWDDFKPGSVPDTMTGIRWTKDHYVHRASVRVP
ncbi:hypothetical protein F5883DRAFT_720735 [Diaporthe sp. PMI_573]|nr:hypothetical protein F5883DRAFT_720735 [Diaporthaceae sp. PMI_573]